MNQATIGSRARYTYNMHISPEKTLLFDGLMKYDVEPRHGRDALVRRRPLGQRGAVRAAAGRERRGRRLPRLLRARRARRASEVHVLDARDMTRGAGVPAQAAGARAARVPRHLDPGRAPAGRLRLTSRSASAWASGRTGTRWSRWRPRASRTSSAIRSCGSARWRPGTPSRWPPRSRSETQVDRAVRRPARDRGAGSDGDGDGRRKRRRRRAAARCTSRSAAPATLVVERWHGRTRRADRAAHPRDGRGARPLLAGEKSGYEGELVRTDGYRLRLPAPATSLTVAAFGRQREAWRRSVGGPDGAEPGDAGARSRGWARRRAPRLAAWVPTAVDPTPESARAARRGLIPYLGAEGYCRHVHRRRVRRAGRCGASAARTRRSCWSRSRPNWRRAWDWLARGRGSVAAPMSTSTAGLDDSVLVPATAGDDAGASSQPCATFAPDELCCVPHRGANSSPARR